MVCSKWANIPRYMFDAFIHIHFCLEPSFCEEMSFGNSISLFLLNFVYNSLCTGLKCSTRIVKDWIRTLALWCQKWPPRQLFNNHYFAVPFLSAVEGQRLRNYWCDNCLILSINVIKCIMKNNIFEEVNFGFR